MTYGAARALLPRSLTAGAGGLWLSPAKQVVTDRQAGRSTQALAPTTKQSTPGHPACLLIPPCLPEPGGSTTGQAQGLRATDPACRLYRG